jgi:hypothetical protein
MTFTHFNRRLHLYLSLTLAPWFLMYGISSFVFAHPSWFQPSESERASMWIERSRHEYTKPVPEGRELREFGRMVLNDLGFGDLTGKASFGAYRPNPATVDVFVYTFRHSMRLRYNPGEKQIIVEDRRFRFNEFLTGMHARGGFNQDGFWQDAWAVVVDIVCFAFLIWVATGLIMWWKIPSHRRWGWIAMGCGLMVFGLFMATL